MSSVSLEEMTRRLEAVEKKIAPAQDGPTEEQMCEWAKIHIRDYDILRDGRISDMMRHCWQAARVGMVPARDTCVQELTRARGELEAANQRADAAEKRAAELESDVRGAAQSLDLASEINSDWLTQHNALSAELERVKVELEEQSKQARDWLDSANRWLGRNNYAPWNSQLLPRVQALLRPTTWTTLLTAEQVGAAWDALSEGQNYVATKWDMLKPGHREHYVKVANSVLQVPAPASDEVTEEDANALRLKASDKADAEALNNGRPFSPRWFTVYATELIRLARRNRPQATAPSDPLQLPLTDEQRTELAKAARDALVPARAHWPVAERWPLVVDALAPRIARVGLRELTDAEIVALANELMRVSSINFKDGDTRISLVFEGTTEFARAILAAAQNQSEVKP